MKVLLQHTLPHRPLSAAAYRLARCRWRWLKDGLIDLVIARFGVDMSEAADPNPRSYPHFNAFFTRALKPGARPQPADPQALAMPADGRISQAGIINAGRIIQAKGHDYTLTELLGDADYARGFEGGGIVNIYLSPRDYHRVHMPYRGRLLETLHIPGRLFSVAPWAVAAIPGLFARNERLVCRFETEFGPMAVLMVGAMLVSGIETVWGGEEVPPYATQPIRRDLRARGIELERGAEMARFNYGSTVIVLLPPGAAELAVLAPEQAVRLGETMGRVNRAG